MVSAEAYTRDDLKSALKKLFSCMDFDQILWGFPDEDEVDMDAECDVIVDELSELYTEKLYPEILDAFDEHIPYMKGHDAKGHVFFDHTFLYHPAVPIYYETDESVMDGDTDIIFFTELYLQTDGEVVRVETTYIKSGDFEMEYRRKVGVVREYADFCFDEDVLYEMLDDIASGKYKVSTEEE